MEERLCGAQTVKQLTTIFDTTYFWLFLPSGNAFNNVAMMCGENNWESMHANDKCIRVTLAREEITAFLTSLGGCLSGPEFGQSKVTTTSIRSPRFSCHCQSGQRRNHGKALSSPLD